MGDDVTVSLPVAVMGLPAQPLFVGRGVELSRLAGMLAPEGADTADGHVVVSAVAGLAGVGKTALVLRAAHDAITAGWFPGGALVVDLRGYDPPERQVRPSAALASLLGALGTPSEHIPAEQSDRERLWRSRLAQRHAAGQRMLVVLDNASSAGQVRPLLPGTDGHRVVITSRHSLADLAGVRLLDVDVLPDEHAIDLLGRELAAAHPGDDRVRAEPAAAGRLGRLCGGLPLAVHIAAALLAAEPDQPIAELAEALASEHRRLEELEYDGSLSVRAAFDLSYQHLAPRPARLFRLFAVNPGLETSTEAAAALADLGVAETRRVIGHLRRARLLLPGSARGRWRMHDLVRLYATGLVSRDPAGEAAVERLLAHYLANAKEATSHFDMRLRHTGRGSRFASWQEAISWLDTEHPNLVAAVTLAHDTGHHHCALHLPLALYPLFYLRKHWGSWVATHRVALAAARRLGDRPGESFALTNLGSAYANQDRFDEATKHLEQALEISDDPLDRSRPLSHLGSVCRGLGRFDEAIGYHRQALEIRRRFGTPDLVANTLAGLGADYQELGRFDEALDSHRQVLEIRRELQDRHGEARTLTDIGMACRGLGEHDEARSCFLRSVKLHGEVRDLHGEGRTLVNLGHSCRDLGQIDEALARYRQALAIYLDLDPRCRGTTLADIGDVFHALGDHRAAIRHWREAHDVLATLPGPIAAARTAQLRTALADTTMLT